MSKITGFGGSALLIWLTKGDRMISNTRESVDPIVLCEADLDGGEPKASIHSLHLKDGF